MPACFGLIAAPAAAVEVALCHEAIIRLAGETWCALPSPNSGSQTRARLDHLLRPITSLIGIVTLSLLWDQPEAR